jgi:hypothetical protein
MYKAFVRKGWGTDGRSDYNKALRSPAKALQITAEIHMQF